MLDTKLARILPIHGGYFHIDIFVLSASIKTRLSLFYLCQKNGRRQLVYLIRGINSIARNTRNYQSLRSNRYGELRNGPNKVVYPADSQRDHASTI
jgi:hypothetical protein